MSSQHMIAVFHLKVTENLSITNLVIKKKNSKNKPKVNLTWLYDTQKAEKKI